MPLTTILLLCYFTPPKLPSPIHLKLIMSLNLPYRLSQISCLPMPVIGMGCPVLVENNTGILPRGFRGMDIPKMPRILRLYCHIKISGQHNIKIRFIQHLLIPLMKHPPLPLSQTTPPMPSLQSRPQPLYLYPQNTSHTHPQKV